MSKLVYQFASRLARAIKPTIEKAATVSKKFDFEKKIYRTPVSLSDFRNSLLAAGEWRNRVVFVQSSWNQFYNIPLSPKEFIGLMIDLVGPDGTLAMPTFPLYNDPNSILQIDTVPSSTGLVTEIFRRWPQSKRSIHLTSAVSAVGPQATDLTSEHHLDPYSWGVLSPYGKMIEADALMVLLGVMPMGFTPLHNVECVLREEVPIFSNIWGPTVTYNWQRRNGEFGTHSFHSRAGRIRPIRIASAFPPNLYRKSKISNLSIQSMDAKSGVEHAKLLAKQGLTIYSRFQ